MNSVIAIKLISYRFNLKCIRTLLYPRMSIGLIVQARFFIGIIDLLALGYIAYNEK